MIEILVNTLYLYAIFPVFFDHLKLIHMLIAVRDASPFTHVHKVHSWGRARKPRDNLTCDNLTAEFKDALTF